MTENCEDLAIRINLETTYSCAESRQLDYIAIITNL